MAVGFIFILLLMAATAIGWVGGQDYERAKQRSAWRNTLSSNRLHPHTVVDRSRRTTFLDEDTPWKEPPV